MFKDLFFFAVGGCSLGIAIFNEKFYWKKGFSGGDKPTPRWVGRVLFGTFGIVTVVYGIAHLLAQ